uniref:J domain-containing protein n=1 Tax=Trieres chinensis TaxID=1514140 RepID=A0A7S1ZKK5_TRICV
MPSGAKIDLGSVEEELRRKEAEKKARKAAEDERKEEERAEAIRAEREAKFEADLKKMDEAQRNAAKKQKARDAKVVRKILAASERGRHYAVLGLRGWDLKVGPWHLFQITSRDVKKAYRNAARSVHPDKNRDGRANEAFRAVEDSAAILGDEKARKEYDRKRWVAARKNRRQTIGAVVEVLETMRRGITTAWLLALKIMGPFKTPIYHFSLK